MGRNCVKMHLRSKSISDHSTLKRYERHGYKKYHLMAILKKTFRMLCIRCMHQHLPQGVAVQKIFQYLTVGTKKCFRRNCSEVTQRKNLEQQLPRNVSKRVKKIPTSLPYNTKSQLICCDICGPNSNSLPGSLSLDEKNPSCCKLYRAAHAYAQMTMERS